MVQLKTTRRAIQQRLRRPRVKRNGNTFENNLLLASFDEMPPHHPIHFFIQCRHTS